jgi:TP901 family phage tail tape measure protein
MSDTSLIFNLLAVDRITGVLGGVGGAFSKFALGAGIALAVVADKSIKAAADFESSQLRLVNTAGESAGALKMVSAGVLDMTGKVGVGAQELSTALYTVESAGFHGANGLKVLEAASKGAKIEGADVKEVADAVSSALVDYHLPASRAAEVTNTLIAAVGRGKTTMQELSAAMPNVLAAAHDAGLSLGETSAALATMTMHGTSATVASTYLRQVILSLESPGTKARAAMKGLGLDANQVSLNLGKNGLASTIEILEGAIRNHLTPAGLVAMDQFKKSAGSAADWQKAILQLPPAQRTAIGAMADMVGGVKQLQGFLQLGGENLQTFKDNTAAVAKQVRDGGKDIDGFSKYQQTFNYKLDSAKASLGAVTIAIGTHLLPVAKDLLDVIMSTVGWFEKHKTVAIILATAIGSIAAGFLLYKTYLLASTVATNVATAAQWLFNIAMDANPVGLVIIAVVALVAAFVYLWTHSASFRNFWISLWNDIWGFLKVIGAWFAGPFANFFVAAWHDISAGALWLWHNVLDPFWQTISTGIAFVQNIVKSFANLWLFIWKNTIGAAIMWLWHNVWDPAIHAIADGAVWLWQNVITPVAHGIGVGISAVGSAATWLWKNAIGPAFHGIADVALWLWHNVISPVFGWIGSAASTVAGAVRSAFSAIGGFISSAFSGAVGIVRGALNGVISVINSAIGGVNSVIGMLNKVPGVSFPHMPSIPHLDVGGDIQRTGVAVVHQGERVVPAAQVSRLPSGGGTKTEVTFTGNTDSAFATAFMRLVRAGVIQVKTT